MMIGSNQEMILLKANLSTGLYLHITVDDPSTVMIQRKMKTSYLEIISPQEVAIDVCMTMKGIVVIFLLKVNILYFKWKFEY